ncbi:MAG TPA: BON domain-containing protein [Chthoniobacterales bacterium]|jgi:osmotically-inducible protein OsmY|nr:BON domain-containing protein [Chthoniobacterales bacterium]
MKIPVVAFVAAVGVAAGPGCQRSDREATRERAERLKTKAEATARQLGQDAKKLGAKIDEKARQAGATRESGTEQSPEEKLKRGAAELEQQSKEAGTKLSQASQSAKVKYNLSAALGLSAASKIEVDSSGNTVTLRGTVASADQRAEAERVALSTTGVIKVVNELRVRQ